MLRFLRWLFSSEAERIASEIAKGAAWNEGYQMGYRVGSQSRPDSVSGSENDAARI